MLFSSLVSELGRMVKFKEDNIRAMGRTASGVKGINLDGSKCVCAEVVTEEDNCLFHLKLLQNNVSRETLLIT